MQFSKLVNTIISEDLNYQIHSRLQEKMKDKELPFGKIFGNNLRIVEPLNGGKQYEIKIKEVADSEYEYDFENWAVFKKKDTLKKNPIRIGKYLNNLKNNYTRELRKPNIDMEVKRKLQIALDKVEALLNTTNLHNQYKNAMQTSFVVVYSRAPVDVIRMGDFPWRNSSCHAPGGGYFHCATADALGQAGVIYLITSDEYYDNEDKINTNEEIFLDNDRGVKGIRPVARMRIRRVLDNNGNELAVPVTKIYAIRGQEYNNDMVDQVIDWAKKQDTSDFVWDKLLTLRGGSYEDSGYEIDDQIEMIWGKNVKYIHYSYDEEDVEGIDNSEEVAFDHIVDELTGRGVEGKVKDLVLKDDENPLSLDYEVDMNYRTGKTEFKYTWGIGLDSLTLRQALGNKLDDPSKTNPKPGVHIDYDRGSILFVEEYNTIEYEYFNADNYEYDIDTYVEKTVNLLQEKINSFIGGFYSSIEFAQGIANNIRKLAGITEQTYDELSVEDITQTEEYEKELKSFIDKHEIEIIPNDAEGDERKGFIALYVPHDEPNSPPIKGEKTEWGQSYSYASGWRTKVFPNEDYAKREIEDKLTDFYNENFGVEVYDQDLNDIRQDFFNGVHVKVTEINNILNAEESIFLSNLPDLLDVPWLRDKYISKFGREQYDIVFKRQDLIKDKAIDLAEDAKKATVDSILNFVDKFPKNGRVDRDNVENLLQMRLQVPQTKEYYDLSSNFNLVTSIKKSDDRGGLSPRIKIEHIEGIPRAVLKLDLAPTEEDFEYAINSGQIRATIKLLSCFKYHLFNLNLKDEDIRNGQLVFSDFFKEHFNRRFSF